jgi:hypothetical protein
LRHDPFLAVRVDQKDPQGQKRVRARARGKALAGTSTRNRLELTSVRASAGSRSKQSVAHLDRMQAFLVAAFLQPYVLPRPRLVLDLDATDNPLHGHPLGRFFHGSDDAYGSLPFYLFCGDHPLLALLRPANSDTSTGALKHLIRILTRIRQAWPAVQIVLRGDSGFGREHRMRWCEANGVDDVFGLAKDRRLLRMVGGEMHPAKQFFAQTKQAARLFKDFTYRTHQSWSRDRRVVGKAEYLAKGENPRFVVTSLAADAYPAQSWYEQE